MWFCVASAIRIDVNSRSHAVGPEPAASPHDEIRGMSNNSIKMRTTVYSFFFKGLGKKCSTPPASKVIAPIITVSESARAEVCDTAASTACAASFCPVLWKTLLSTGARASTT
jgi:hypothetical protein